MTAITKFPGSVHEYGLFTLWKDVRAIPFTGEPVVREKIFGRWHTDSRVSSCCVSRGFLQAENIPYNAVRSRSHPFNTETSYLYESIGTVTLDLSFANCPGRWKVEATVMDYSRLCRFDDVRKNSTVSTGFEVTDDRPLWFDCLLGRTFEEAFIENSRRDVKFYRDVRF